jgi:glycosyltransferase involved in cell wall biosynthesis
MNKILLTTGIFPPEEGGPATYSALLEKELPRYGIQVEVLPFRTVRHLPPWIRHLVFFWKVLQEGFKKDLLYAQDPLSVGFPTMLAAKLLGKPFLVRIAGDYAWEQATQRFGVRDGIDDFQKKKYGFRTELMRFLQTRTASMADTVIDPSKYFCELVGNWNPGKIKAIAIYNGIDLKNVKSANRNYEKKTIISAGRLVPWKGFDFLIREMSKIPDWRLLIAGDGPDRQSLHDLIIELNLTNRVSLLGSLDRQELMDKIQQAEIFALNTSFESFSFIVVEAMSLGTPVITTNVGNLSEIIDDSKEGLLIEPNNSKSFQEAVAKLQKSSFREEIIKNAKVKSEEFGIEKTMKKTAEVMTGLINRK